MKFLISILFVLLTFQLRAQELFTWSEPASNMAAKSVGFRVTNLFTDNEFPYKNEYRLLPEIMWGISKKVMIHTEGFFDNTGSQFAFRGCGLYLKYRFLSNDDVHSHFRMAAFGRFSALKENHTGPAINLNGDKSGYELGLVATKLIHKIAISAGAGFLHADRTIGKWHHLNDKKEANAIAYNLSFGKLMLPKEYTSYEQTNMNLMLEMPGQTNAGNGKTYLDLAPTVQFIILSRIRIDAGYRFAMLKKLERSGMNTILLRLEYSIFNVY